jgi:fructokinase
MASQPQNAPPEDYSILGIGELLWDILPTGPRLGGAPANFTSFCARLGNHARLVTRIGDDEYGRASVDALAEFASILAYVQVDDQHPTGTVNVTFGSEKQPSYEITEGVAWDYIHVTEALRIAFRLADAVCFGTLCQRSPCSREAIRSLVSETGRECVRVCDVNVRLPYCTAEVLEWSMKHATIIKVSDEELPFVLATTGLNQTENSPEGAVRALLAAFPDTKLIAITRGSHGCMLADRQTIASHPGFPIRMVDTVGAGDAFTAGLTHAILRGASLDQAAKIANLCGSFVASQPTASPLLPPAFIARIASELLGESCEEQTFLLPE